MTTYDIFMHYYNDNIGKAVTNLTKCEWHSCLTPAPEGSNHVYMELGDMNESRIDEGTEALETLYISGTETNTTDNTNIYEDYIVKALTVNNPKYDMIFVYDGLGYYNSQQGTSEDKLLNKLYFDKMKRVNFQPWFFHSTYHSLKSVMNKAAKLVDMFGKDHIMIGKEVNLEQYIDIV